MRRCGELSGSHARGVSRRVLVGNANPHRTTDPKRAALPPPDVLAENDAWLGRLARQAQWTIAAWGDCARAELAERALEAIGARVVYALALTKRGVPRHPLYLRSDLKPFAWRLPIETQLALL